MHSCIWFKKLSMNIFLVIFSFMTLYFFICRLKYQFGAHVILSELQNIYISYFMNNWIQMCDWHLGLEYSCQNLMVTAAYNKSFITIYSNINVNRFLIFFIFINFNRGTSMHGLINICSAILKFKKLKVTNTWESLLHLISSLPEPIGLN